MRCIGIYGSAIDSEGVAMAIADFEMCKGAG